MQQFTRRTAAALVGITFLHLTPRLAAQATITAIAASADTTLYEDPTGAFANGAGESLFVGRISLGQRRRALVAFDIAAALPPGAHVVQVELRLQATRGSAPTPLPITVHRTLASWNEGTANATFGREGQGTLAGPGDSTWLHRNLPGALWQVAGGDFDPQPHGLAATADLGIAAWAATNAMVADVQQWLDAPATNFGWLLRSDELVPQETRRFASRTTSAPGVAPQLVVTWIRAGEWIRLGTGCGTPPPLLTANGTATVGGAFAVELRGRPGVPAAILLQFALQLPPTAIAPGCDLFFAPAGASAFAIPALDLAGRGRAKFDVPGLPVLAGLPLVLQAAVADPGQPLGFAISNAVHTVLR